MKKERGITLVALIITIIVLLILAGVTIGQAATGTGLFTRAKNAANAYNDAAADEANQINSLINAYDNEANQAKPAGN